MLASISKPQILFAPAEPALGLASKLSALIEVALVVVASIAAAVVAQRVVSPGLGETLGLATGTPPDYLASSIALAAQFGLQYGAALALALFFGIVRGRRAPRHYAIAVRPVGLMRLVALGVITGFIASIPTQAIFLAKEIWPLGKDPVLWSVMESNPWDWTFWVFAATGSFILVPVIEELMWRSYVLGRLVEAFRPGPALILTSLIFAGLHFQYLTNGDFLGYATVASVIVAALLFGLVTLATGSVIPAIIAHMILNVPMSSEFGIARLALGVLLLALCAKPVARYAVLFGRNIFQLDTLVMLLCVGALVGAGYAVAAQHPSPVIVAAGVIVLAIAGALFMKSPWREGQASATV